MWRLPCCQEKLGRPFQATTIAEKAMLASKITQFKNLRNAKETPFVQCINTPALNV